MSLSGVDLGILPLHHLHLNPILSHKLLHSIENLWLAATSEGYGCNLRIPRGNEESVAQSVLGFPDEYLIPCFIGIGRQAPDSVLTKRIPVDLKMQIHWDKF